MKCCLCGDEIEGYGNNPEPLTDEGRCCDECNQNVIKFRWIVTHENIKKAHHDYNDKKIDKLYNELRINVRKMCLFKEQI